MVEDSQKESESIVSQARAHADRIREESDRELVAATQRRDSINAQLTNVRQMLATLTSAAPAALFAEPDAEAPEAVPAAEAFVESDLAEIEVEIDEDGEEHLSPEAVEAEEDVVDDEAEDVADADADVEEDTELEQEDALEDADDVADADADDEDEDDDGEAAKA
jgi:hypothetical protein